MPFWDSSAFWGIAGIVGGILVATFFFVRGKSKKLLEYQITSTKLITETVSDIPNLKISVGNETTWNLTSTTINFSNMGNSTLYSSDIASKAPIQIISTGRFFNSNEINSQYIKTDNEYLNPFVDVIENNKIIIGFEYLKPKQNFSITVLHDGQLSVSGDLTTGKLQPYSPKIKDESTRTSLFNRFFYCAFVVSLITIAVLFYNNIQLNNHIIDRRYESLIHDEFYSYELSRLHFLMQELASREEDSDKAALYQALADVYSYLYSFPTD